jgi:hypothetical protein
MNFPQWFARIGSAVGRTISKRSWLMGSTPAAAEMSAKTEKKKIAEIAKSLFLVSFTPSGACTIKLFTADGFS